MKTLVKELPILMSSPMVRGILAGDKTETRRTRGLKVLNERTVGRKMGPGDLWPSRICFDQGFAEFQFHVEGCGYENVRVKFPYGNRGTRLWVRETWAPHPYRKTGYIYRASPDIFPGKGKAGFMAPGFKWKPSLFMPKPATRIWLEVVRWDIQHLCALTEAEAKAEGVGPLRIGAGRCGTETHRSAYRGLWDRLNGNGSFDLNPWTWVIKFKRVG